MFNTIQETLLKDMTSTADKEYVLSKAAEELMELALVLIQQVNKPDKDYTEEIQMEAGHVKLRLRQIDLLYDDKLIQHEADKKLVALQRWREEYAWKNL